MCIEIPFQFYKNVFFFHLENLYLTDESLFVDDKNKSLINYHYQSNIIKWNF